MKSAINFGVGNMDGELDLSRIPTHIAVIMDGNGRWAKNRGFLRSLGHENGVEALRRTATRSAELGVKFLTVYAFSTENWNRPKAEVDALMGILVSALRKELDTLQNNNIKLEAIGDLKSLPGKCLRELEEVRQATANNQSMTLTLALSYSSKSEMVEATKSIAQAYKEGRIELNDINDTLISNHLYTSSMPDPDLLIRTSGEYRISNYLLWQIAYSELYFCPKLWPDFREDDLNEAIAEYQRRERRYGKTSEQLKS